MNLLRFMLLLILVLLPLAASGGAAKLRPATGKGVLLMPAPPVGPEGETPPVPLYLTPGVGRIRDLSPRDLPGLAPALEPPPGMVPVAVTGKKNGWLRIFYDEAGHEGWVSPARSWRYLSWEDYLGRCQARLLPGLPKSAYLLRGQPGSGTPGPPVGRTSFVIVRITDDWAFVNVAGGGSGWVRWRDDNGRFLVAVEPASSPQNR